jgi:hypothetical protein
LNGPAGTALAPFPFVNVTLHGNPAPTGTKPPPVSCNTVTVNVCGAPTSFVAFGAITIAAFTHNFDALPLPPAVVFAAVAVARVIDTVGPGEGPTTGMSALAPTTVVPVLAELIVTVQLALVVAFPTTV